MVKLQLVEDSRPCRVVDSVKCRRVMPTVTICHNDCRHVPRSSRKGRDALSPVKMEYLHHCPEIHLRKNSKLIYLAASALEVFSRPLFIFIFIHSVRRNRYLWLLSMDIPFVNKIWRHVLRWSSSSEQNSVFSWRIYCILCYTFPHVSTFSL